jgi:hypothetical protein
MKKYKLLKDLPGKKTGEIITLFQNDKLVKWYDKNNYEVCVDVTNPEWFEEVKEQPTTKPVLELFKVSENIYSDGRAAAKTYKVELIGRGYDNKKPDIDNILKNIEPFCSFRNFMKLSDTEKEIIEDLRKAKETGISMNNFSMTRGCGGTVIEEVVNMFIKGATITGGTVKTPSEDKQMDKKNDFSYFRLLKDITLSSLYFRINQVLRVTPGIKFYEFFDSENHFIKLNLYDKLLFQEVKKEQVEWVNEVGYGFKYPTHYKMKDQFIDDRRYHAGLTATEKGVIEDLREFKDADKYIALMKVLKQIFDDAKDGMIHSETK